MPRVLVTQSRNLVIKLYEYFERESQNGGPLLPVTRVGERAAAALGLSPKTVSRILKEKYGASGMEDNELKTPGKTRIRKKTDLKKSLIPVMQPKVYAADRVCGQTVNLITKDNINMKQNRKYKSVSTDYKGPAFFAVEYSETSAKDSKPLSKTEPQKSVTTYTSEPLSVSGPWNDEPVSQENDMQSINLSRTSDPLTIMDDSYDFNALNTLTDPALLITKDNVTTDQLIPIKQENIIEESNGATCLDKDEILQLYN